MFYFLEKHRIISLILTVLVATEIFFFSTIVSAPGGKSAFPFAIIYHFCVFFLLSFFLLIAIKGKDKIKLKHIALVFLISLIYSISDEIHQSFVPGRDANIKDILTDLTGITMSIINYLYSGRNIKKQIKLR